MTTPQTVPAQPEAAQHRAEFTLRAAADGDVPELVDLVQAAYRGEGGWTTERHLVDGHRTDADEVRAMLADPQVTLLVADLDGALVGCCYTRREPVDGTRADQTEQAEQIEQAEQAELGLFAVHPEVQSRGLGGRLLEAQAELLRDAGCAVLMIQVLHGRPELQDWYRRHGFTAVGRAVPFAGNPDWLKVAGLGMDIMERPLR